VAKNKKSKARRRGSKKARRRQGKAEAGLPELTAKLQQIKEQARAILKSTRRNLYSLGTLYGTLVEEKYAQAAGFRNAEEFWLRHVPTDVVGIRTVQTWSRISAVWASDVCDLYSPTCLDLLLRLQGGMPNGLTPDPGDFQVTAYDDDNLLVWTKAFRDCMEVDMKYVTRRVPEPRLQVPPEDRAKVKELLALIGTVDKSAKVTVKNDGGTVWFTLKVVDAWFPNVLLTLQEWAAKHRYDPTTNPFPTVAARRGTKGRR
jgi:hypothetical protein